MQAGVFSENFSRKMNFLPQPQCSSRPSRVSEPCRNQEIEDITALLLHRGVPVNSGVRGIEKFPRPQGWSLLLAMAMSTTAPFTLKHICRVQVTAMPHGAQVNKVRLPGCLISSPSGKMPTSLSGRQ